MSYLGHREKCMGIVYPVLLIKYNMYDNSKTPEAFPSWEM